MAIVNSAMINHEVQSGRSLEYKQGWNTDLQYSESECWKHYAKWKKPVTEVCLHRNKKQIELGGGRDTEWLANGITAFEEMEMS